MDGSAGAGGGGMVTYCGGITDDVMGGDWYTGAETACCGRGPPCGRGPRMG